MSDTCARCLPLCLSKMIDDEIHVRFKSKLKLTEFERVCLHNGGGLNWTIPSIPHSLGFALPPSHCQVAAT